VTTQTKSLAEQEAKSAREPGDPAAGMGLSQAGIRPDGNGVYQYKRIYTWSHCIAIATLPVQNMTEGGIELPNATNKVSDSGIVVGVPDNPEVSAVSTLLGKCVKFRPQLVAELTGEYEYYGDTPVVAIRQDAVVALLEGFESNDVSQVQG
jgi:hypothetical protein